MKFQDQAILAAHTNRLQAASRAQQVCNQSFQDPEQVFDYAGVRFAGSDAQHIKGALMTAMGQIAEDARAALVKGGVEFDEQAAQPSPKQAEVSGALSTRKYRGKKGAK